MPACGRSRAASRPMGTNPRAVGEEADQLPLCQSVNGPFVLLDEVTLPIMAAGLRKAHQAASAGGWPAAATAGSVASIKITSWAASASRADRLPRRLTTVTQ